MNTAELVNLHQNNYRPESGSQLARKVFLGEKQSPTVRRLSMELRTLAFCTSSIDNSVTLKQMINTNPSLITSTTFISDMIRQLASTQLMAGFHLRGNYHEKS